MSQMQYGGMMDSGWGNNFGYCGPYGYPKPTSDFRPVPIKREVDRVHGEDGANAFPLAPNSSAIFLDETQPVVWLKTTDSAGYATVTGYSIMPIPKPDPSVVEVENPKPVDTFKEDVMARLDKLERMIENNARQSYAQPTRQQSNTNSKQSNDSGSKRD